MNHNKIPDVTFPINDLDMSQFVDDQQPTSSYHVEPEEFYNEEDMKHYQEKNKDLFVEPQDR